MRVYVVSYRGLWMGGQAVVLADSPEQATEMVRTHPDTVGFEDVKVQSSTPDLRMPHVIVNDNGDY